jgi:hypothetical protein
MGSLGRLSQNDDEEGEVLRTMVHFQREIALHFIKNTKEINYYKK